MNQQLQDAIDNMVKTVHSAIRHRYGVGDNLGPVFDLALREAAERLDKARGIAIEEDRDRCWESAESRDRAS